MTLPAVREALKKYILPIFDPATSICAIASAPSRTKEIANSLKEVGYDIEERDLDLGVDDSEGESGSDGSDGSEMDSESEADGGKGRL